MPNFEINKIVNSLKFEIRKLFSEKLNIHENKFTLIDEYTPEKIRSINFDNAENNTIYKLKTNFIEDKLNLMKEIIYDSTINGFYVFNHFFIRDSLLNNNSFPITETLDISLKIRSTEVHDEKIIMNKLKICLEIISLAILQIQNTSSKIKIAPFKELTDENSCIIDFDEFFSKQKHFKIDKKVEESMKFYDFILIKNWKNIKSEYFNNISETGANKTYKILFKIETKILDLGYINIFYENDLFNIVLNWDNILLIMFDHLSLEQIINIPESLIAKKGK